MGFNIKYLYIEPHSGFAFWFCLFHPDASGRLFTFKSFGLVE